MTDLEALQALANPGPAREGAARHLYFQWGKRLLAHFSLNGAPGAHAEDVLQETVEKIFRHADSFRGETPDSAAAWIWTVATNTLDDYRDRLSRQPTHGAEGLDHPAVDEVGQSVRGVPKPDEETWLAKARECVRSGVQRFAFRHARDAYALWMQAEGHSVAEIAERLGKTPNATAVLLVGCRDRLRPWLENCRRFISGLAT